MIHCLTLLTCSRSLCKVWSSLLGISNKWIFGWRGWENIWACSFLRQYAERGYSSLLPFCSIEWEIYFSQAWDCSCGQAGASCYLSLCLGSKSSFVGNCFVHPTLAAGPAWLENLGGAAAAARGLQRARRVEGGHGRSGNRCGL